MGIASRRAGGLVMWLRWILSTAVGFTVGGVGAIILGFVELARCRNDCDVVAAIVWSTVVTPGSLLLGGALAAVLQAWLVLSGFVPRPGWWIVVSAAGFLSFPIIQRVLPLDRNTAAIITLLASGAIVGVLQWAFLRTRLPRAGWWILGAILVYGPVSWFLVLELGLFWGPWGWLWLLLMVGELVALGIGIGASSGAILAWMVRHRRARLRTTRSALLR